MPTKPTRKVTAATLGGALSAVIVGVAVWAGAPQPPAGLEAAFATAIAAVTGYFTSDTAAGAGD